MDLTMFTLNHVPEFVDASSFGFNNLTVFVHDSRVRHAENGRFAPCTDLEGRSGLQPQ